VSHRFLLDENVEHEVGHRLEHYGHDVEHVDFVPGLGKGSDDDAIGSYSRAEDRVIVTYDDDFVLEVPSQNYTAALYVPDGAIPADDVADAVHAIAVHYPQDELDDVVYVGAAWLE